MVGKYGVMHVRVMSDGMRAAITTGIRVTAGMRVSGVRRNVC
jgi:hypothetical protein